MHNSSAHLRGVCAGICLIDDFVHANVERSAFVGRSPKGNMGRVQEAGGGDVERQRGLNLGDVVALVCRVSGFLH